MDYQDCISAAKAKLSEAANLLSREIAHYPTPIAGCDLQFNHLLEERQRLQNALESLEKVIFTPTPRALVESN